MPKYQFLGAGPVTTRKTKDGTREYLQRVCYVAPIRNDGAGTGSAVNVYLTGDAVNIIEDKKICPADMVFCDFNHRGFLQEFRPLPTEK